MNWLIFVGCLIFSIILATNCIVSGYESKYDDVNLDEVLKSERLLTNYIKCLLKEGPCTADAQELKDILPDAIETDCLNCTEKQKNGANKVSHYIIDNRPDDWELLAVIYDPDGEYKRKYFEEKDEIEKEKNNSKTT